VWHALVDGTGFLELVVENETFRPKTLPTEDMEIQTDEFGNITEFIQKPPSGDDITFEPHEIAILRFHRHPDEDFGRSLIEQVEEQANILRDMEIDTARFIATKAYPPILWKCGTEERPWTQQEVDDWLEEIDSIEPSSQLAVGHDVDYEAVGVTSTSSSAGALRLEPTFKHLMQRIATGLGVPSDLLNTDTLSGSELSRQLPNASASIRRRSFLNSSVTLTTNNSLLSCVSSLATVTISRIPMAAHRQTLAVARSLLAAKWKLARTRMKTIPTPATGRSSRQRRSDLSWTNRKWKKFCINLMNGQSV